MADRPRSSLANLRAPFDEGNAVARKHGAYREEEIVPLADALVGELADTAPWVSRPCFDGEVLAAARADAMAELLWRFLVEHGPLDGKGKPRAALDAWLRVSSRASSARANLGLSPRAFAQLLKASAESGGDEDALDTLKAEGRRIREASGE